LFLGLGSALRAFEQGEIFIAPHLLWHRALVFPVSFEWSPLIRHTQGCGGFILTQILTGPHLVASYDTHRDVVNLFLPRSSWVPIQSPLTTRKGMLRTFSHPDPHGFELNECICKFEQTLIHNLHECFYFLKFTSTFLFITHVLYLFQYYLV
jgi:hypothetical protein